MTNGVRAGAPAHPPRMRVSDDDSHPDGSPRMSSQAAREARLSAVALSRRSAHFFASTREVAATFVDIVKFAMRGLPAPTVASFRQGFPLIARIFLACSLIWAGIAAAAAPYPLIGRQAPDFALHALVGSNVRLSEHLGEVVVLSFWGSRCGACSTQLGALNRSLSTYQSVGLRVFGVSVDDDQARALEYAKGQAVSFPLLLDPSKSVSRLYQVDNLPMTVLIDRNGIVRHVHRDYSAKSEALYLQELRALLNE
jgi:peroxiredoxin